MVQGLHRLDASLRLKDPALNIWTHLSDVDCI